VEAARVAMVDKEQRRQELMAHPERYFPQPWTTAPEIQDLVSRGVKALFALPIAASGGCSSARSLTGRRVVTWGHKPGADYVHLPLSARIETPQKAVSRLPIPGRRVQRTPGPLLSREECTRLLYQGTQLMAARACACLQCS
jgi:hypothetical protein